ncbi:MAG: endonuclease III [Thermodesulfobacteriota bacterium]
MDESRKKKFDIDAIVRILRQDVAPLRVPIVTEISRDSRSPFAVLVSTLLSLRTKDEVTREAAARLLGAAGTPQEMLSIPQSEIEQLIYPVGFYKTKAANLLDVCRVLIDRFDGNVPEDLDELLKLKGVGRKTANLVVTLGFGKQGVCVDTHVHRICNRLGYVKTKTPEQTEMALRERLPQRYWIEFNDLLVTYGQNICRPISPFCSRCRILPYCLQVGVTTRR